MYRRAWEVYTGMAGEGLGDTVRIERSPKRVRALLGGQIVFDTLDARLVWEVPYYPQYYIPRDDVHATLVPTGHHKPSRQRGNGALWTVEVGGHRHTNAAATFDESPISDLHGLVRFKWDALDSWFEEDEEVFAHARSPYTRVDILPTSRPIRVESGGVTVAETTRGHVLYETGRPPQIYLPEADVHMGLLEPSDTVTSCPHKGRRTYWTLRLGDRVLEDGAWSYPSPLPECSRLAGLVGFENRKVDVFLGGVRQE
jgi:uncharacterized protein (DUF427 family)